MRELLNRAKSCLDLTDEERGRHATDYEIRFMELARIHQKVCERPRTGDGVCVRFDELACADNSQ